LQVVGCYHSCVDKWASDIGGSGARRTERRGKGQTARRSGAGNFATRVSCHCTNTAIADSRPAARSSSVASRGVRLLRHLLAQATSTQNRRADTPPTIELSHLNATSNEPPPSFVAPSGIPYATTHHPDIDPAMSNDPDSILAVLESMFPIEFTDWHTQQQDTMNNLFPTSSLPP
jgi:hypothetical protein